MGTEDYKPERLFTIDQEAISLHSSPTVKLLLPAKGRGSGWHGCFSVDPLQGVPHGRIDDGPPCR